MWIVTTKLDIISLDLQEDCDPCFCSKNALLYNVSFVLLWAFHTVALYPQYHDQSRCLHTHDICTNWSRSSSSQHENFKTATSNPLRVSFFLPSSFLRSVITGGFRCSRFRVQLSCIQGGRVQLLTQRVQWLSIHYWSVGMKAVHLILDLLRRCGLRWSRLCWGLWLRLGLLFFLGLSMKISKNKTSLFKFFKKKKKSWNLSFCI